MLVVHLYSVFVLQVEIESRVQQCVMYFCRAFVNAGGIWWNVTNMPIAHELVPLERSVMMLITSGVSYGYF